MEKLKFKYTPERWQPVFETLMLTQGGSDLIIGKFRNENIPKVELQGNLLLCSAAPVMYQNIIRTNRLLTCYIDYLEEKRSPYGILNMSRFEVLMHQLRAGLPDLLVLDSWLNEFDVVKNLLRQIELNYEVMTEEERGGFQTQVSAWLAATP